MLYLGPYENQFYFLANSIIFSKVLFSPGFCFPVFFRFTLSKNNIFNRKTTKLDILNPQQCLKLHKETTWGLEEKKNQRTFHLSVDIL